MKIFLVILISIHGLIHLLGFAKAFDLAEIQELSLPISKFGGSLWLLSSVLFLSSAALIIAELEIWWKVAFAGIILSQLLILFSWQDAKFGSIANLLVGLAILIFIFSAE